MSKPYRTILWWQLLAIVLVALPSAFAHGMHGVISAVLGGLVGSVSGVFASILASRDGARSAGGMLAVALGAEAARIVAMAALLWAMLVAYRDVALPAALGSLVATAVIFSMAFFIRDSE